jgi:hypothetical protein
VILKNIAQVSPFLYRYQPAAQIVVGCDFISGLFVVFVNVGCGYPANCLFDPASVSIPESSSGQDINLI